MTKTRGCRIACALKRLGGGEQFALRSTKCLARLLDLLIAIIYQRQQLLRTVTHGKYIVHGGTPLPQKSLKVGIPLAHASELARVKRNAIAISTQLVGAILE